jgi:hypothetical protein
MRRTLLSAACALACIGLFLPTVAGAENLGFPYYGGLSDNQVPLIPCSGFARVGGGDGSAVVDPQTIGYERDGKGALLPECESICDIFVLANRVLWLVISVMVTIIGPVFFFIGGFMLLISGGSTGRREEAMRIIKGTAVGLLILLCASLIVNQMLFLIFNANWGEAIKARVENNKDKYGFSADQVKNLFTWNSIACSVENARVKITPAATTPKKNTPPVDPNAPIQTSPTIIINQPTR